MQNFSQLVTEARERKNFDSYSLLSSEINAFMSKVKKQLPKNVQDTIYLTTKFDLMDRNILDRIKSASRSELQSISDERGIAYADLEDIQKQLKSLKNNIRLLPQYQSKKEREEVMAGKLAMDDLVIDLETEAGRNAVAKLYTPMVYKIVSQREGKSRLDKAELISAGMEGLAKAINEFDKEKAGEQSFKTYASYRILQSILDEENTNSHTLSGTNWYAYKKEGSNLDTTSIDNLKLGDDEVDSDRLAFLAVEDDLKWVDLSKTEKEYWEMLFKELEKKFSSRDCNIFYRFFGLKEFWGKKEKSKDIAKSYGMSEGNVRNSVLNRMLKYILNDPKTRQAAEALRRIYCESLMKELIYLDNKQAIYEALISDDMFILLEELNRWNNRQVFINSIHSALDKFNIEDAKYLIECLQKGFSYIDDTYKKHKNIIIFFLSSLYPTENFNRVSDVTLIDEMNKLSQISIDYKIVW